MISGITHTLTLSSNWQLFTAMNNAKKSGRASRCDTIIDPEDGQTYALRKVSSYIYVSVSSRLCLVIFCTQSFYGVPP
jgi:hypothetical protein